MIQIIENDADSITIDTSAWDETKLTASDISFSRGIPDHLHEENFEDIIALIANNFVENESTELTQFN